jgi:O-antigen/teichoic acid export membrane protein
MISRSFLKTGIVVIVGNGIAALVGLAALRLYTELAPAKVFGSANLLLGVLGLGSSVLIQPIINTQLRYQTDAEKAGYGDQFAAEVLRSALAAACVLAVLILIGLTAWSDFGPERLGPLLLIAAVAWIFASTLRTVFMSRLHAEQRMKSYMALRVGEAALGALATAAALAVAPVPQSYLWGQAIGPAALVGVISLLAPWPTWRLLRAERPSGEFLEKVRRYGTPFVPMAMLVWLSNLADRYVLAAFLGAGAAGQYLAAFSLASNGFLLANGAMGDLFRPMLFDAENTGEPGRAGRIFAAWLATYVSICVVGLVLITVFGGWIVRLLLAEAYRDGAVEVMLWVGLGYSMHGLTIAFENRIFSMGIPCPGARTLFRSVSKLPPGQIVG